MSSWHWWLLIFFFFPCWLDFSGFSYVEKFWIVSYAFEHYGMRLFLFKSHWECWNFCFSMQSTQFSTGCKFQIVVVSISVFYFILFLAALHGLQDLSSPTRDWTWALAVKVPSPNHWTAREFPQFYFQSFCSVIWINSVYALLSGQCGIWAVGVAYSLGLSFFKCLLLTERWSFLFLQDSK